MTSIHFSMRASSGIGIRKSGTAAQQESRFLITQDLDFPDARKFSPASHGGILLLRLRNPSRTNLVTRALELFREETADDWVGLLRRCYRTQDSDSKA